MKPFPSSGPFSFPITIRCLLDVMNTTQQSTLVHTYSPLHYHVFHLLTYYNDLLSPSAIWSCERIANLTARLITHVKLSHGSGTLLAPENVSIVRLDESRRILVLLHVEGESGARILINMPWSGGILPALDKAISHDLEEWYTRDTPTEHPAACPVGAEGSSNGKADVKEDAKNGKETAKKHYEGRV